MNVAKADRLAFVKLFETSLETVHVICGNFYQRKLILYGKPYLDCYTMWEIRNLQMVAAKELSSFILLKLFSLDVDLVQLVAAKQKFRVV